MICLQVSLKACNIVDCYQSDCKFISSNRVSDGNAILPNCARTRFASKVSEADDRSRARLCRDEVETSLSVM